MAVAPLSSSMLIGLLYNEHSLILEQILLHFTQCLILLAIIFFIIQV